MGEGSDGRADARAGVLLITSVMGHWLPVAALPAAPPALLRLLGI